MVVNPLLASLIRWNPACLVVSLSTVKPAVSKSCSGGGIKVHVPSSLSKEANGGQRQSIHIFSYD